MLKEKKKGFKKGAASFYIVAFSTLILMVIAASFTTVILSNLARTSNDDLSQSAYDSALAGIEDAKVAYYNYQNCLQNKLNDAECKRIKEAMGNDNCDMVANILGRGEGEVRIEETSGSNKGVTNNMEQAYTCVKIATVLDDYRSTLTESNPMRSVKVRLATGGANDIKMVKVKWGANEGDTNYSNIGSNKVQFPNVTNGKYANPPVIAVGLIQTGANFSIDDFAKVDGNNTNRGTVFLVPSNNTGIATNGSMPDNSLGAYKSSKNVVMANQIAKSNDRTVKNLPLVVYCKNDGDFRCSAELRLPNPIGGIRNDDTFMINVSLPYGNPSTDFALEFYSDEAGTKLVKLSGMQINVDSTGRANNLYRRVSARLEASGSEFPIPLYAIELLGNDGGSEGLLTKPTGVTAEYNY